ncbi:folate-binding protein [Luteimonas sp. MJ204]|uniref:CAF17-like 4Fe-4S cluster assembly/insertion protein YgfZ n=1 Tax=Luteimonas sp. MJ145 TaxID=3129234 RepID=UPI0031BB38E7
MDKPAAAQAPFFALSDHALLALEGRDAIAFAQAQFMGDLSKLADGQWQWSGWLTPKGRVQALFALLRVGPETLRLLLPDGDADALAAALGRFVFRSKVKLRVPEGLSVCGAFAAPGGAGGAGGATVAPDATVASGATARIDADGSVELDFGDGTTPRTLRIALSGSAGVPGADAGDAAAAGPRIDADALARWRAFDIAHGLPRPGAATLEAFTPQQLSLDRLRGYSVHKGCYPGQEIVARTHFLGQAKRGLVLFGCAVAPTAGASVMEGDRALGTVVAGASAAGQAPGHAALALAVLPLERADDAPLPHIDGAALTQLPLLDGLAR